MLRGWEGGRWEKSTWGVSARREYGTRPQVSWDAAYVNCGTQGNPQILQKKEIIFLPKKTDGDKATGLNFGLSLFYEDNVNKASVSRTQWAEEGYAGMTTVKDFKDSYRAF